MLIIPLHCHKCVFKIILLVNSVSFFWFPLYRRQVPSSYSKGSLFNFITDGGSWEKCVAMEFSTNSPKRKNANIDDQLHFSCIISNEQDQCNLLTRLIFPNAGKGVWLFKVLFFTEQCLVWFTNKSHENDKLNIMFHRVALGHKQARAGMSGCKSSVIASPLICEYKKFKWT